MRSLFDFEKVSALAEAVKSGYDPNLTRSLYFIVDGAFQSLIKELPVPADLGWDLFHLVGNQEYIDQAIDNESLIENVMKTTSSIDAFHKEYDGVLYRLNYCLEYYPKVGLDSILNNLGKAAVLLKVEPPKFF